MRMTPLLLATAAALGSATAPDAATGPQDPIVAFVDVNVIPMDRETVLTGQSVIVDGGFIVEVGPAGEVEIPPSAMEIDGSGRYLMPGLVDMHVHLDDASQTSIYVAYGITTVLNLRGSAQHLDWRRRIEEGTLFGPTLFTSGPFVNEPAFITPGQIRAEVALQAAAGYDLIKPHGELSRDAYDALIEAAGEAGLDVLGHAPRRLGLEAVLDAGQSLAHGEELIYSWFAPWTSAANTWRLAALIVGAGAAMLSTVVMATGRMASRREPSRAVPALGAWSVHRLTLLSLGAALLWSLLMPMVLPDTPFNFRVGDRSLLLIETMLGGVTVLLAAGIARHAFLFRGSANGSPRERVQVALALIGAAGLATAVLLWLPLAWRSGNQGIGKTARAVREAGLHVIPNLVAYEAIAIQVGPGFDDHVGRPEMRYLPPETRRAWGPGSNPYRERFPEATAGMFRRNLEFLKRVTRGLHEAGVPLLAGSDAMNPGAIPGLSLHEEIRLLIESGLSPYEALRTATIEPAGYLGADTGAVLPGRRADLILLIGNPLDDPGYLSGRLGVMMRGEWYPVGELDARLEDLAGLYEREERFLSAIRERGLDAALAFVDDEGRDPEGRPVFRELRMNRFGYELMEAGRLDAAIRVFDLNVRAHPDSANAWDSLGEALMSKGDAEGAARAYETSLTMNPANTNAAAMLQKLR